jgi:hypothetical protein
MSVAPSNLVADAQLPFYDPKDFTLPSGRANLSGVDDDEVATPSWHRPRG